jgi:predicted phosphate transport protein (TIGR00153 family)
LSDRLSTWFEKRRQSKTLMLAQRQMLKAIDSISELEKAVNAFNVGNSNEVGKQIEQLFQDEVEIDELRREVYEELTKGELPTKYREDLKSLVGRLDRMADFVKDAARSIKILVEAGATVPKEILDSNLVIAKNLVECSRYLNKSIEMLGTDPTQIEEFALKVDASEGIIDAEQLNLKILFIKNAGAINAPTLMVLKDLVDSMEQAADMCSDTADYVRTLARATDEFQDK